MAEIGDNQADSAIDRHRDLSNTIVRKERPFQQIRTRVSELVSSNQRHIERLRVVIQNNEVNEVETWRVKDANKEITSLEDDEKELVAAFNQVLSNLYILPGYVLAVCTAGGGLLSSDPKVRWLFFCVLATAFGLIAATLYPIKFAHRQIGKLIARKQELSSQRENMYKDFQVLKTQRTIARDPKSKKLNSFEIENSILEFQGYYYDKFLWLVGSCGMLYAFMLCVAAYSVLWVHKENPVKVIAECCNCTPSG